MTEFTPLSAAIGGLLIGLAAVLMMLTTGRIAGVSGYLSRLLPPYSDDATAVRLSFVVGLFLAPPIYQVVSAEPIATSINPNVALLIAAGLLVGFGSVWGGGCTSGHGVCGLARFSVRSLAATAAFMATGIVTVFVTRHLLGG